MESAKKKKTKIRQLKKKKRAFVGCQNRKPRDIRHSLIRASEASPRAWFLFWLLAVLFHIPFILRHILHYHKRGSIFTLFKFKDYS
jgi:hypothetical protein